MTITFDDDPELRDAIAGIIEKRMQQGNTKRGDVLITLMGVAREVIRAGHLQPEARYMVLRACIDRLCLGRRGPTQMIPQQGTTHVQGFADLVRDMEQKAKAN